MMNVPSFLETVSLLFMWSMCCMNLCEGKQHPINKRHKMIL